jgi:hypothetical protein
MSRIKFNWSWLAAIILGFGVGLAYAWLLSPVQYVEAGPKALGDTFKDDYRAAISAAYAANGDLERARARLALLEDEDPIQTLTAQAQRMLASGEPFDSIQQVALLAAALQGKLEAFPVAPLTPATNTVSGEGTQTAQVLSPTLTLEASSQVIQSELTATSISPQTPTPRPTRTSTPTLGPPYQVVEQDTICDPELSEGLLQVVVMNNIRRPVPGVEIIISSVNGEESFFTGLKPEIGNGYADFVMDPDVNYSLRLVEGGSPVTNLTPPQCTDSDGNPYNGGMRLTFQQP